MNTFASAALAIAMICAMLLIWGGLRLARNPEDRQKGLLMIAAAIVLIGNVLIWTL